MSKQEQINQIYSEILNLKNSPLYKFRNENNYLPVIGEGSLNARIMFIGEAPGRKEAESGKPFCGQSGKVLDMLLASVGLDRKKVYITSVVKDRPPQNRDPFPAEIKIYSPFLDRQIEIIKPKVLVGLGRFATKYLFNKFKIAEISEPISKLNGKVFETDLNFGKIKIVPLFHPAATLHGGIRIEVLKKNFLSIKKFS